MRILTFISEELNITTRILVHKNKSCNWIPSTEKEFRQSKPKFQFSTDTYPENPDHSVASNNFWFDIYVSLRINAGGGTGIETWIHDNTSSYTTSLANAATNALVAALGKTIRGVKKAPSQRGGTNIHVIDPKNTKAWAILL
ncbi:hypothetical protein GCM10008014_39110 [Paenibacillus silvae]|uniref:Uncharacterized protein n=1 Tax=Paenibacillus silvae TaxID=1325358 RepID=A0ABQ1ZFB6_9BACL|nr:N-acetylmuramoyl-L-alanine amidase [Paenibacillus silvae]GGH62553.1 hypothetical protein GCM10008014_39110 [Paenibacillus silvae]